MRTLINYDGTLAYERDMLVKRKIIGACENMSLKVMGGLNTGIVGEKMKFK